MQYGITRCYFAQGVISHKVLFRTTRETEGPSIKGLKNVMYSDCKSLSGHFPTNLKKKLYH